MNTNVPKELLGNNKTQIRLKSEDWESYYANHFSLDMGLLDLRLHFGRITNEEEEGKAVVCEEMEIILPKELGKILWILLGQHLDNYEKQVGEIVLPSIKKPTKEEQVLASAARRKAKK